MSQQFGKLFCRNNNNWSTVNENTKPHASNPILQIEKEL